MAHALVKNAGRLVPKQLISKLTHSRDPRLQARVGGLEFANPLGLAAGFDKNGEMLAFAQAIGFGFMEVGSITNLPCAGRPKPRIFRLPKDESLINRMGLPNKGVEAIASGLIRQTKRIPYGVNIAKTPDFAVAGKKMDGGITDQLKTLKKLQGIGAYVVFNLSCPNTDDGCTFEDRKQFRDLAQAVRDARRGFKDVRPYLIKLSPDLDQKALDGLLVLACEFGFDGFVVGNTSLHLEKLVTSRELLASVGVGGLSGRALFDRSNQQLQRVVRAMEGKKMIIACGGVMNFENLVTKLALGADLVQIYTGLIYRGPLFVVQLLHRLQQLLHKQGLSSYRELKG